MLGDRVTHALDLFLSSALAFLFASAFLAVFLLESVVFSHVFVYFSL